MKKLLYVFLIGVSITVLASCDYDDSNDIDILTPNDTTETGVAIKKLPA
ncbi:hypothetical protein DFQ03_1088 [Maribacter caenipelagi]|uniref:Uncharacterized protein n=1 Tax=Maribacter caenipelagi TaxID=1447781 RepID=A0A4R7D7I6_9FLAO|nr:hypothetical protein [Maribacter caenipelagi]TDS16607.1 hypothetical protein DFQ03_1088 [Maribacter caenipelagi]|tara:strand:+ start:386 stop:532 length:147 start_codon:yes stop_codon:yes gene_type:complete